jgi:hypothetical protein
VRWLSSRFGFLFSSIMLNINIKAAPARAVFMVISRELRNSVDRRPHGAAALRCWTRTLLLTHKQTNEFAAHGSREQSIPGLDRQTDRQSLHCTKPTGSSAWGRKSSENLAHTQLLSLNPTLWCRVATRRPSARCFSTQTFTGSVSPNSVPLSSWSLGLRPTSLHCREPTVTACRPEPAGRPARPQTRLVTEQPTNPKS